MSTSINNIGSIVAVTGANRGIGAAIAIELARTGFTVACLTRQGNIPDTIGIHCAGSPSNLVGVRCDVTDVDSVRSAIDRVRELPGKLRGLVNCAGIIASGPSASFSVTEFDSLMRTNVTGTFNMCQAIYQPLVDQGDGLIVNIGSLWDQVGVKAYAAYCASKAAVGALTRCLGVEWAKKGIRVIDVAPGYIETDMTAKELQRPATQQFLSSRLPLGRVGQPDEVGRLVAALFTTDIGYLTATTIYIDGGQGAAI
jgi:NAD(P)-dependent dehydrogenase (short-subunit alcohol dehydrogenase family)